MKKPGRKASARRAAEGCLRSRRDAEQADRKASKPAGRPKGASRRLACDAMKTEARSLTRATPG